MLEQTEVFEGGSRIHNGGGFGTSKETKFGGKSTTESAGSLSLTQQAHLVKVREQESRLKEKGYIAQDAKCRWIYMRDKPWFWREADFYPPIGVISEDLKVARGENRALGKLVGLDEEGQFCILVYEENIQRIARMVREAVPYSEEDLQRVAEELSCHEALSQKKTRYGVAIIIRRLANTRLLREKLQGHDQIARAVVGHEMKHIHGRLSGNEPRAGVEQNYLFAHEAVAYLTEFIGSDIPFNLLTRLAGFVEDHGEKMGKSVEHFIKETNLEGGDSKSLVGSNLALDFMLREIGNTSLFENGSGDEQPLSLKDLGEKLTSIMKLEKKDLDPLRRKLIRIVDDYDSTEDKVEWLREKLGLDI